MTGPKVSVCCPWYNRADYLADTVNSLLSQDYDDFEIIIVNDGSPDPAVARILDSFQDPRLTVIHQENTGLVPALRRAVAQARGAYIAIQGAGDVSHPARLRLQAAVLDAGPNYVAASCLRKHIVIGGPKDGRYEIFPTLSGGLTETELQRMRTQRWNPSAHGEIMFRRTVYDAVGGYRTAFPYSQDIDLWLRMSDHGTFYVCPEILYERRLFTHDGIKMDIAKTTQQTALSIFSRECYAQRQRHGFDIIDIFGDHASLFRRRNRAMAQECAKTALKYLYAGKMDQARFYATLARHEKMIPVSLIAAFLTLFFTRAPCFLPLYKKIIDGAIDFSDLKTYN